MSVTDRPNEVLQPFHLGRISPICAPLADLEYWLVPTPQTHQTNSRTILPTCKAGSPFGEKEYEPPNAKRQSQSRTRFMRYSALDCRQRAKETAELGAVGYHGS